MFKVLGATSDFIQEGIIQTSKLSITALTDTTQVCEDMGAIAKLKSNDLLLDAKNDTELNKIERTTKFQIRKAQLLKHQAKAIAEINAPEEEEEIEEEEETS